MGLTIVRTTTIALKTAQNGFPGSVLNTVHPPIALDVPNAKIISNHRFCVFLMRSRCALYLQFKRAVRYLAMISPHRARNVSRSEMGFICSEANSGPSLIGEISHPVEIQPTSEQTLP